MALVMTPIYTQTVGAGGAATITLNNIPQFYTDLKAVVTIRSSTNADPSFYWGFNSDGASNFSLTRLTGTGSAATSARQSNFTFFRLDGGAAGTGETANTFSSIEFYIPNYTSSNFKQIIVDSVTENNATGADLIMAAALWRNTAAITRFGVTVDGTTAQFSTFSLYGIIRSGA